MGSTFYNCIIFIFILLNSLRGLRQGGAGVAWCGRVYWLVGCARCCMVVLAAAASDEPETAPWLHAYMHAQLTWYYGQGRQVDQAVGCVRPLVVGR